MFNPIKNNRGQILVPSTIILLLVVILGFGALAVDIGYFYHTKNELQCAADAVALAGALDLNNNNTDLSQTIARITAQTYASLNTASRSTVFLYSDGSNVILDVAGVADNGINDITVGSFLASNNTYTAGITPVNAIQMKARSTIKYPYGFPRFFGQIFDDTSQDIGAVATAARPARSSAYISFCADICNAPPLTPTVLNIGPTGTFNYSWTSLNNQSMDAAGLDAYICGAPPFIDNLNSGNPIFTTAVSFPNALRNLEAAMYDPTYESNTKGIDPLTGYTYWWVIAPYTAVCPPGNLPSPQPVIGYAQIRIIAICTGGVGSPCRAYSAPAGSCALYPSGVIVIDQVTCVTNATAGDILGWKSVLVK